MNTRKIKALQKQIDDLKSILYIAGHSSVKVQKALRVNFLDSRMLCRELEQELATLQNNK